MFDAIHDFFFGDQLRKHVVLIGAFFLGQLAAVPLLGWLEPSQYVMFAVALSCVVVLPLHLLYNWYLPPRTERAEDGGELNLVQNELLRQIMRRVDQILYDVASAQRHRLPVEQTVEDTIVELMKRRLLPQEFLRSYYSLHRSFTQKMPFSSALTGAVELLVQARLAPLALDKELKELSSQISRRIRLSPEVIKQGEKFDVRLFIQHIEDISQLEAQKIIDRNRNQGL
jgi:hypothetical protein